MRCYISHDVWKTWQLIINIYFMCPHVLLRTTVIVENIQETNFCSFPNLLLIRKWIVCWAIKSWTGDVTVTKLFLWMLPTWRDNTVHRCHRPTCTAGEHTGHRIFRECGIATGHAAAPQSDHECFVPRIFCKYGMYVYMCYAHIKS